MATVEESNTISSRTKGTWTEVCRVTLGQSTRDSLEYVEHRDA